MRRPTSSAAVAAILALAGCAGNDAIYSTRSMPTSAEDSYSGGARFLWTEDPEVYELPANPPAIDDHRPRLRGQAPGQRLKSNPVAGMSDPLPASSARGDVTAVATISDRPDPLPLPPLPGNAPLAAIHHETVPGPRESMGLIPLGGTEDRPASQQASGLDRLPIHERLGGVSETNVWSGDHIPPTSPLP